MAIFKRLVPELKGSITFDKPRQQASGSIPARTEASRPRRGSEFARHALLASASGITTWFCDAPSPDLGQLAEGQRREHQSSSPTTAAKATRPRRPEPGRPPGDRSLPQPHAAQMSRLHNADPGLLQRPWQRRPDPVRLSGRPMRLKRESTTSPCQPLSVMRAPSSSNEVRQIGSLGPALRIAMVEASP